jgi:RNA polymerase sigma-70 factor (ECF subfamily)
MTAEAMARELELLRRIGAGDREAFKTFYFEYSPRIGRFLLKMLKHPERVEEVMNDVLMTVWQSAAQFDPDKGRFTTWLFGIAHNKALKALERDRRHSVEQAVDIEDDGVNPLEEGPDAALDPSTPEKTVLGWELGDLLEAALDRLSPEHRMVLELAFSEGRSYQEIAEIVGCPPNTVKTRVFHAKKKLHEWLERRGYSPTLLAQETLS